LLHGVMEITIFNDMDDFQLSLCSSL
jgi:hypothetical protein